MDLEIEPTKYSAAWIAALVAQKKAHSLPHHDCSLCGVMVQWVFMDGFVGFDSSCDCTRGPQVSIQERTYDDIAAWLRMQNSDEVRDEIMERLQ